ncbi:MAG: hypothetical protein L0229_21510 [Blastocatellia bacterium]|nr:hypothetical protein [Blastocatellia bacterium]
MNNQSLIQAATGVAFDSEHTAASLSIDYSEIVRDLAPAQSYPAAVELFKQGSPAQEAFFIDHGLVKLTAVDDGGQELIVGLRPCSSGGGCRAIALEMHGSIRSHNDHFCNFLHRLAVDAMWRDSLLPIDQVASMRQQYIAARDQLAGD